MFRALATVVISAMLSTSGSAAFQHVHADASHQHTDHQHGLAAHVHAVPEPVGVDHGVDQAHHSQPDVPIAGVRLEACEPGAHVVPIASTFVAPQSKHGTAFVTIDSVIVLPPERAWARSSRPDVRVHSPPRITDGPLRAPPVFDLA